LDRWNVGVLLFDGVALLDVAGPFDVLNRARLEPGVESRRAEDGALFDVFTVARTTEPVTATGGIVLVPRYCFADAPRIDLLLVPGGFGTRPLLQDTETIDWIRWTAATARRTASVCTGALLLGAAGFLKGKRATTHPSAFQELKPFCQTVLKNRVVDEGNIITAGGVSSGIDEGLYVVEKLAGSEARLKIARQMDYPYALRSEDIAK